ncbi:putative MFS family arabinose efflux permease [Rhizobium leguminosarum]
MLLVFWGFFSTPIPVAWNTWMAAIVPGELEAAGGLQVALIQLAIAGGAFAGGMLFDAAGWRSTFLLAACLLAGSAVLAALAGRRS